MIRHPVTFTNRFIKIVLPAIVVLAVMGVSCMAANDTRTELQVTSTGGGSVIAPGEGTFAYDQGTEVALQAEAAAGYRFTAWSGSIAAVADANAASTTIIMDAGYFIWAEFEAIPPAGHTLTIDSTDGGSVLEPGEGSFSRLEGTLVRIRAQADDGYRFVYWSGDIEHVANAIAETTEIFIDADYSIEANFEPVSEEEGSDDE